jgi:hypothetical protein
MLQHCRSDSRFDLGLGLLVALVSTFLACGFIRPDGTPCPEKCDANHDGTISAQERLHFLTLNKAPLAGLTSSQRTTQLEVPNLLKVQHGEGCVRASRAMEDEVNEEAIGVRVADEAELPPGYNTATVFSNGWRLRYLEGDHRVQGFGSAIFNA